MLKPSSACPTPSQDSDSTDSDTTQNTSSTSSRKKRERYLEDGMVYVGPNDEDFECAILAPLGVIISGSLEEAKPIDIFGLQSSNLDSHTIIRKSDKELEAIMRDFWVCEFERYDEHTLCTVCYASIVPRDPFYHTSLSGEGPNKPMSVRREYWKPKKAGPSLPAGASTYD